MVITLDKHKKPLGHCTEKRARQLIEKGRACVYRYYPFTIIIKDLDVNTMTNPPKQEYRIKIDPGSKYTGMAIIEENSNNVILYIQVEHRAGQIRDAIKTRRDIRRNRRSRETWYRKPKYKNGLTGERPKGTLPPSVKSIGDNIISIAKRLMRLMNITKCSFEAVRFDTQLLDNPDIEGVEYQKGTLFGYELRGYLMDKYGHECQYCHGMSKDPVLEWEHKIPKSRGGSDKVSNATLSCSCCNRDKGSMKSEEWLSATNGKKHKTELDKARISGIKNVMDGKTAVSDRYCAWVSSTRRYIERYLFGIFGDVECASGGKTKYNRTRFTLPKDHHYDALCVGTVPDNGYTDLTNGYCLYIKAMGRGTRFRGKINKCGIIIKKLPPRTKRVFGFMNGDIVKANVPKGKYKGIHTGRVMTRASGSFDIRTGTKDLITANYKYCRILQYCDGYNYRCAIPLGN